MQGVHHPFQTVFPIGAPESVNATPVDPNGEGTLGPTMGFGDLMADTSDEKTEPQPPAGLVCPAGPTGVTQLHSGVEDLAHGDVSRSGTPDSSKGVSRTTENETVRMRPEDVRGGADSANVDPRHADDPVAEPDALQTLPQQVSVERVEVSETTPDKEIVPSIADGGPVQFSRPEPQQNTVETFNRIGGRSPKDLRSHQAEPEQFEDLPARPQRSSPASIASVPHAERTLLTEPLSAPGSLVHHTGSAHAPTQPPEHRDLSVTQTEQHIGVEPGATVATFAANGPNAMMGTTASRVIEPSRLPLNIANATSSQVQFLLSPQASLVRLDQPATTSKNSTIPTTGAIAPVTETSDSILGISSFRSSIETRLVGAASDSQEQQSSVSSGVRTAQSQASETEIDPVVPASDRGRAERLPFEGKAALSSTTGFHLGRRGEGMENGTVFPSRSVLGEPELVSLGAAKPAASGSGEMPEVTVSPSPAEPVVQGEAGPIARPERSALEVTFPDAEQGAVPSNSQDRLPGERSQRALPELLASAGTYALRAEVQADTDLGALPNRPTRAVTGQQPDTAGTAPTVNGHGNTHQAPFVPQDRLEATVVTGDLQAGASPGGPLSFTHLEGSAVRAVASDPGRYTDGARSVNQREAASSQPAAPGLFSLAGLQRAGQSTMFPAAEGGIQLEPSSRADGLEEIGPHQNLEVPGINRLTTAQTHANVTIGGSGVSTSLRFAAAQVADLAKSATPGVVDISLSPEELGRLNISFLTNDAGLAVTIVAERPETVDLIRRNITELTQELQALGYNDFSVDIGSSGSDQSGGTAAGSTERAPPEASESLQNTSPAASTLSLPDGLDLRL